MINIEWNKVNITYKNTLSDEQKLEIRNKIQKETDKLLSLKIIK